MYIDNLLTYLCVALGLSVDHVAKRVYYTYSTIKSVDYDGNDERTHFNTDESWLITAIVVDTKSR